MASFDGDDVARRITCEAFARSRTVLMAHFGELLPALRWSRREDNVALGVGGRAKLVKLELQREIFRLIYPSMEFTSLTIGKAYHHRNSNALAYTYTATITSEDVRRIITLSPAWLREFHELVQFFRTINEIAPEFASMQHDIYEACYTITRVLNSRSTDDATHINNYLEDVGQAMSRVLIECMMRDFGIHPEYREQVEREGRPMWYPQNIHGVGNPCSPAGFYLAPSGHWLWGDERGITRRKLRGLLFDISSSYMFRHGLFGQHDSPIRIYFSSEVLSTCTVTPKLVQAAHENALSSQDVLDLRQSL